MPQRLDDIALSSRHPFEVFLLVACLVAGLNGLINGPTPGTIAATLDPTTRNVWLACLALGGFLGLLGPFFRGTLLRRVTGLQLEAIGLIAAGGASLVYAAAVGVEIGRPGAYPMFITGAFGLACGWRALQIRRRLTAVREALRAASSWVEL